ncbi:MAG: phenylacetate--CoA ligase family protein [Candidatus Geothermincolia bacterium]
MSRENYSRNWDRMSFEEQREYRDRKLSYFVRTRLYPYSAFYRKVFDDNKLAPESIRGVEDLRKLPFTYKSDIAPSSDDPYVYEKFVLKPDEESIARFMPRMSYWKMKSDRLFKGDEFVERSIAGEYDPVHVQFTTGRTGLPTPIMYARSDVERMAEAGKRVLELAGFGTLIDWRGATVLNAMPFAPHLGFWMVSEGLQRAGILSLQTGGGRMMGTRRIIGAARSTKPTAVIGMPGYVYHLLRTARDLDADLSSVKLVVLAGERIPKGMKEKLIELLEEMGAADVFVAGTFGFTEGRKAYSECVPEADSGYHLYPDMDYFEIIDPETEEPVAEGEDGELVYTCLDGRGTSVMRFRTGDFVKGGIVNEPCPNCARRVPRLGSDISRTGRHVKGFSLIKLKGALVDQCAFQSVLEGQPQVKEWQVEISKAGGDPFEVDVLDVYVALADGADEEAVREEIDAGFLLETEVKPNSIGILREEELVERLRTKGVMKELHVVDSRPSS